MKKILILLFIFTSFGLALSAAAENIKIFEIEILEYGEFKAYSVERKDAVNTSLGKMTVLKEIELVKQTGTIDGLLGVQFGVKYFIEGSPKGASVPLSVRLFHPKTTNPDTQQASTMDEWIANAKVGKANYSGWIFEYQWEITPGEWTIQLLHEGVTLAEQKFIVQLK